MRSALLHAPNAQYIVFFPHVRYDTYHILLVQFHLHCTVFLRFDFEQAIDQPDSFNYCTRLAEQLFRFLFNEFLKFISYNCLQ